MNLETATTMYDNCNMGNRVANGERFYGGVVSNEIPYTINAELR